MIPIPAVDISGGKAVRLHQGRFDRMTEFASDPIDAVARWVDAGALRVHLVDLDAARTGRMENEACIRRAVARWPGVHFQTGGGIRNMSVLQNRMDMGVRYPVLGTVAVRDPDFVRAAARAWPGQVIVALDARDGMVATQGWTEDSGLLTATEVAAGFADVQLAAILHTDIGRDGTMTGPNIAASAELVRMQPHPVLVSGGVRNLEDLRSIRQCGLFAGAICGRALYEGKLDLSQALEEYRLAGTDGASQ